MIRIRLALTAVTGLVLCATAIATGTTTAFAATGTADTTAAPTSATAPAAPTTATVPATTLPASAASPTANASPATGATATATDAAAGAPGDLLRVTYKDGYGAVNDQTLRCHPAGGTMPEAAQACRRLDELGGPVAQTAGQEMCSMLWGGPQTARITGTWRGRAIDESYSRSNGCQTSRWQRMLPVLPAPTLNGPTA